MHELVHHFLASAKNFRLTPEEKADARSEITARIALGAVSVVSLTSAEREIGREMVMAHMRRHPLPVAREDTWRGLISVFSMRFSALAFSALLVAVGSGAMGAAANSALPGDFLYPLKVDFMERIRGRFVAEEQRPTWLAEKVSRRLEEARALISAGRLSPEHTEELKKRIDAEVDAVVLQPTVSPDAQTVQENIVVTMSVYEETLAELSKKEEAAVAVSAEANAFVEFIHDRRIRTRRSFRDLQEGFTSSIGGSTESDVEAKQEVKINVEGSADVSVDSSITVESSAGENVITPSVPSAEEIQQKVQEQIDEMHEDLQETLEKNGL